MKGAVIHVLGDCVQSAGVALVSPENIAAPPPSNLAKLQQRVMACRGRVHEQVCIFCSPAVRGGAHAVTDSHTFCCMPASCWTQTIAGQGLTWQQQEALHSPL